MGRGKSGCIALVLLSALLFQGSAGGNTPDGWFNLDIVSGWNLIGHSSPTAVSVADLTFTNTSGNTTTWAQSIAQKKLYGYLAYYDSSSAIASERKYKYAGTSGVDGTQLAADTGYWLNSRQAGTLTIPSAGGTLNAATFAWSDLRFHNGTDELNITDVETELWVEKELQYWNPNKKGGAGFVVASSGNLNTWQGHFVYSYKDNMTLIRQN